MVKEKKVSLTINFDKKEKNKNCNFFFKRLNVFVKDYLYIISRYYSGYFFMGKNYGILFSINLWGKIFCTV